MADFLLELLSEEIPARMQAGARNSLARLFAECTSEAGLATGAVDVHSTPRRLVLIARDVADATDASREELKGPRSSAPPQALEGFLRKTGLAREQLEDRDGVFFAVIERAGRPAAEILADTVRNIVADFSWPKSMRWGDGSLRWVRPLHGIVAMLGEEIVPVDIDGIASGATTVGHRFHHPGAITVGGASDYIEKLRACHVIVEQDERERIIREGAAAAAAAAGLQLIEDEGLVVENAGLTEWPVPLLGRFDDDYLDVPREVIVLTMRTNQKYFACTDRGGLLAPAFVCVANVAAKDDGAAIVEGNRRVLAARLADARFFWEQDLKVPLEEQAQKLGGIVFHEKLGTVADKVERVAKLARWLVEQHIVTPAKAGAQQDKKLGSRLRGNDEEVARLADQVERAARLAKADLVTGMVGEFPELQGVIGGYLAEAQGETKPIADAVRDHYKPVGQADHVPTAPVTVAISLADKLDSVCNFFAVHEAPTGSKDPFAIRRAALGAIALIKVNGLRLDLVMGAIQAAGEALLQRRYAPQSKAFKDALDAIGRLLDAETGPPVLDALQLATAEKRRKQFPDLSALEELVYLVADVRDFFLERMEVAEKDTGTRVDVLRAAQIVGPEGSKESDLFCLLARVKALQKFIETAEGTDLLTAYKRAANILKKEKWEGTSASVGGDLASEEEALVTALDKAEPKASAAIEKEDFTGAMAALSSLRKPIDDFFDHVTVNDPDAAKRERRLNLLMRFRDAVNRVADFSRIEG